MNKPSLPKAAGIGLRHPHIQEILSAKPEIPYLEVLADNYLTAGGIHLHQLDQIRENYPISFHCVGMSLGSVDPIDKSYLQKLARAIERYQPCSISDHLSWSGFQGQHFHDLLPIPYTEEAIRHLCAKIEQVQELLKRPLILENVSSYISFNESEMNEAQFLAEISKRSGCLLLLDINNIYVSAKNHQFDALSYIDTIPENKVAQYHLAGHERREGYLLDTHSQAVTEEVWDLFTHAVARIGVKPTLIEWDNQIPELQTLLQEAEKAQSVLDASAVASIPEGALSEQEHKPKLNTHSQAIAC